jgi:hypothetical protein
MPALRVATAGRADRCIEDATLRIERNRVGRILRIDLVVDSAS